MPGSNGKRSFENARGAPQRAAKRTAYDTANEGTMQPLLAGLAAAKHPSFAPKRVRLQLQLARSQLCAKDLAMCS